MKQRTLVPFLTLCSSTPSAEQTISDMQSELRRMQAQLTDESRRRAQAEAHVAVLQRNRNKPIVVPRGDIEEGYECNVCGKVLVDEYEYCPSCGGEIDWYNRIKDADESTWREAHVSRPLFEVYNELLAKARVADA